jgi:hypothetical protein
MDYRTYTDEEFRENYLRGRIFEQESDEREYAERMVESL